jgi:putative tributyrin esterase
MANSSFERRFQPVEFSDSALESGHIRNLTFYSEALRGRGDVSLFVPPECVNASNVPVVVLLHGVYGSHWAWFLKGAAHHIAERLIKSGAIRPMILAAPSDGLRGDGTGYLPHPDADYERWIVSDVVDCIHELFPCSAPGKTLFLTGLSMGGFGALRLGAKYAGRFQGISALSAITHVCQSSQFVRHSIGANLSDEEASILYWIEVNRTRLPPIRFDCGKADDLLEANRELHKRLSQMSVVHEYAEYEGGHNWEYWKEHLTDSLLFFEEILKKDEKKMKENQSDSQQLSISNNVVPILTAAAMFRGR